MIRFLTSMFVWIFTVYIYINLLKLFNLKSREFLRHHILIRIFSILLILMLLINLLIYY